MGSRASGTSSPRHSGGLTVAANARSSLPPATPSSRLDVPSCRSLISMCGCSRWKAASSLAVLTPATHCSTPSVSVPRSSPRTASTASRAALAPASVRSASTSRAAARLGEPDRAGRTAEQRRPQLVLQRADGGGQPRLGHGQTLGSPGEVPLLGDRDEVLQLTQFHD